MGLELSQELLKKLAGAAAYARGVDYFKHGHVTDLNHDKQRITATVEGSDTYAVTLRLRARSLEGACDCPASEGVDFCKHCVAVGLAALADKEQNQALEKGSDVDRIKAYLLRQNKEVLVDELLRLVEFDRALRQRYALRMAANERGFDFKALRKQVTASIPTGRQLYRYPQVRGYFARVEELVDYLAEIEPDADADKLQELIEYAVFRIDKALETIDDSGGFRLDAVARLGEMHCRLMARNTLSPEVRAQRLLELLLVDGDGLFPAIPDAYSDALGSDGARAFWSELQKGWDKTPPPRDRTARFSEGIYGSADLLLKRAKATDDVAAQLAIRSKLAVDGFDYFELAEFCYKHALYGDALAWLDKSVKVKIDRFGYQLDERGLALRSQIYSAQGQHELALATAWKLFEKIPQFDNVERLLALAKNIDVKTGQQTRAKILQWLRDAFDRHRKLKQNNERLAMHQTSLHSDTLIEMYLQEADLTPAWEIAAVTGVDGNLLQRLADASWSSYPDHAARAYRRLIESEVTWGTNEGYRRAAELLQVQRNYMRKHKAEGFEELVGELRVKFKPKRNFIKLLSEIV